MAFNLPNLKCRMYEARFPIEGTAVMVQVKNICQGRAYVSLLEYGTLRGMLLFSEISLRRIRSIHSFIRIGRIEPMMVIHVDEERGYVNVSRRTVSEDDIRICNDRYHKSKVVHSIMTHVAEIMETDLKDLYFHVGWPLYRKYGHAFEAFKLIVNNPDSVLNSLTREFKETGLDGEKVTKVVPAMTEKVKDSLIKNIRQRMSSQSLKIRADIEMKCFQFDGVLHIKDAMRKAEAAGNKDCPVKIKLVAPPSYVLITQTLDKEQGISVLTKAIAACTEEIEKHKGKLIVKEAPRAVSEREDILLAERMAKLGQENEEFLPTQNPRINKNKTMAFNLPNLKCRMYEARFPIEGTVIMVQVKNIYEDRAYVSLLEYGTVGGLLLFSEISLRRIRNIHSFIKIGSIEPMMAIHVDEEKGYVNVSRRRVSKDDIRICGDRYHKSKVVHSIMSHVAEIMETDLKDLYFHVGWPLYRKYGHAFEAFKLIVNNPDSVLNSLTREVKETGLDGEKVTKVVPAMTEKVRDSLVKNIRRKMSSQSLKIQADIEMKCFQFDGALRIKDAMWKGEAAGNKDCPVKIKLVAPPSYVLITQTLDKEQGISVLTKAIAACTEEIEKHKGKLIVKGAPRAVSEREDILLAECMYKLGQENEEIEGDVDTEEEEGTGMGDIDLEKQHSEEI